MRKVGCATIIICPINVLPYFSLVVVLLFLLLLILLLLLLLIVYNSILLTVYSPSDREQIVVYRRLRVNE